MSQKNPRSNAGSPACAHSKSSRIRPPECTRMFLGLKSPRTSVRSCSGPIHGGDQARRCAGRGRDGRGRSCGNRGRPAARQTGSYRPSRSRRAGWPGASAWIVARIVPSRAAIVGSTCAGHQLGLPGDGVVRGAGHGEQVIRHGPRTGRPGTVPSGRIARSSSSVACSVQIRSSRARQSIATRSRSRHCLITKGGLPAHVDPQDDVGNAALSSRTCDLGFLGNTTRVAEIVGRGLGRDFAHRSYELAGASSRVDGYACGFNRRRSQRAQGWPGPAEGSQARPRVSPFTRAAGSSQRPGKTSAAIQAGVVERQSNIFPVSQARTSRSADRELARRYTLARHCGGKR